MVAIDEEKQNGSNSTPASSTVTTRRTNKEEAGGEEIPAFFRFSVDSEKIESGISQALGEITTKGDQSYRTHILLKEKAALDGSGNSCLSRTRRWAQYSFWTALALVIQIIFGAVGWAFPDGKPACHPVFTTRNKNMCGLSRTLESSKHYFNLLAAFIIGGFIISSVKLWLTRRQAYTSLCGATRNLLIIVSSIVQDTYARALLIRWTMLGYELAVMKGRKLIDSDITREYLDDQHLLEMDEWEAMVDGDRHTTVWFWILKKSKQLQLASSSSLSSLNVSSNSTSSSSSCSSITDLEFQTICNAVSLARDRANDLMSCIDRDQPPPYIYVCAILVNINLLLVTLAAGIRWAIMSFDAGGGLFLIWKQPRMIVEVLVLYLFTSIFALLFDVTTILYNPFGPRSIDVKHFEVGSGIRSFAKKLQQHEDNDPQTMKNFSVLEGNANDNGSNNSKNSNNGQKEYPAQRRNTTRSVYFAQEEPFMQEIDYKISASVKQSEHTLLNRKSIIHPCLMDYGENIEVGYWT